MLEWMTADAESLPLQDSSVDGYTVAFGVRNMTNIPAALREAHRVGPPTHKTLGCAKTLGCSQNPGLCQPLSQYGL